MSPARRMVVAGNWKMHTSLERALALVTGVGAEQYAAIDTAVCPPFPWLVPVANAVRGNGWAVSVGAQDCSPHDDGAYTGEVSSAMLRPWCALALAGHSERRRYHHESDELIGQKVRAIAGAGMTPVLCIGETQDERDAGKTERVLENQLQGAFAAAGPDALGKLVIAYEPVWAIGTGVSATESDAASATAFIRGWLGERAPAIAHSTRILYGGSVTPENARGLFAQPDVDGALVGGASLKAEAFNAIRQAAASLAGTAAPRD